MLFAISEDLIIKYLLKTLLILLLSSIILNANTSTINLSSFECATFEDGLQTRESDGIVEFKGNSILYNNPDHILNTFETTTYSDINSVTCVDIIDGSANQTCQASSYGGTAIVPIHVLLPVKYEFYDNLDLGLNVDINFQDDADYDIEVGGTTPSGTPLILNAYDEVSSVGITPNHLNFKITDILTIEQLITQTGDDITFTSQTTNTFELVIKQIPLMHSNTFTANTLLNNIKIEDADFGNSNTIDFNAIGGIIIDDADFRNANTLSLNTQKTIKIDEADFIDTNTVNFNSKVAIKIDDADFGNGNNANFNALEAIQIKAIKFNNNNSVDFNTTTIKMEVAEFKDNNTVKFDAVSEINIQKVVFENNNTVDFNARTIKMEEAIFRENNNLNFNALESIQIEKLTTEDNSNITLTAPRITIGELKGDVDSFFNQVTNLTITIKADYIDIGDLKLGDAITLNIIPFTQDKEVLVKIGSFTTEENSILNFAEGTYYITDLDTKDGQWNIDGKVNLILGDWDTDGTMVINADRAGGQNLGDDSHSASDLFIYSKEDIELPHNTRIVGMIYSEKNIILEGAVFIKGALSANEKITLNDGSKVYYDDSIYQTGAGECGTTLYPLFTHLSGPFDSWDTFRDDPLLPPSDRNISTKVVNTPFRLSLASLNMYNNAYALTLGTGNIEAAIYPSNSNIPISNTIIFNVSTQTHLPSSPSFNVASASADAVVGFKLCATYEHNATVNSSVYNLYDASTCFGQTVLDECNAVTNGTPTWRICRSTDNFSIRPHAFRIFRANSYARAGEDFNISIRAVDLANYNKNSGASRTVIGTTNYNVNFSNIALTASYYSPTHTELEIMYKNVMQDSSATDTDAVMKARVATCATAGSFNKSNASANFIDGNLTAQLTFSETGILTITANEILGQEFAKVDADDTPASQRLILGSPTMNAITDISKNSLLLVNTYALNTVAVYNTSTSKAWIYMDDISTSTTKPQMSTYIHYIVTAINKDGYTTQNFTSTCFPDITETWPTPLATDAPRVNGLKLNTTYDFKLAATMNSTAIVDISIYNSDINENPIWISNSNRRANLSVGDNNIRNATMEPKQFTNGVAESFVHFNVDRNVSTAQNPVTITVVDANTWLSWSSSASPAAFNAATLNQSYNYLYGRTNAPKQRFTTLTGNALIYYEAHCAGTVNGNICQKALLPNGANSKSTDDPRWFINTEHTNATGSIGNITQKNASFVTAPISSVVLTYNNVRGLPYSATMENNASTWLIHNPFDISDHDNEFNVEFINPNSNWAGKRETDNKTGRNASDTTNRRTMW